MGNTKQDTNVITLNENVFRGGLFYRTCKLDLNVVLKRVDTAIKARNDNFKNLLKKIYLHIEKKNRLYQRQKSAVEEHYKEMQKLRAHARRVNEEKTEAKKLYELDITSFKAQECEHQLSISQEHKDTLEEEMLCFDAEYKDLRENEMVLADSTKNLQHLIDEKEKQIKEKELEINTRQIRDETHLDLVSKYTDDVENLRSEIAELKEAFQAKQLTLDTLQSEMRQYKEDELNSKDDGELMEFLESEHEMLYDELQDRIKYATDLPLLKKQYEELHAKRDAMANIITDKTEKLVDHKDELEKLTEVAEKEILEEFEDSLQKRSR
ncbi:Hypothetical predicted protein [Octopus vulgaris]|uniref:Uncharacterized protein n=1 Tax=Octopus vulgaris TaxID=6645 RepID=A0AA36BTI9_OCTVU|nr:Hypothetical predicted protein [Octopus vulgaris]